MEVLLFNLSPLERWKRRILYAIICVYDLLKFYWSKFYQSIRSIDKLAVLSKEGKEKIKDLWIKTEVKRKKYLINFAATMGNCEVEIVC